MSDVKPPSREKRFPSTYTPEQCAIVGLIRGFYDMQKLRIASGNRICAQFKTKLGQNPSQSEEDGITDAEDVKLLDTLRAEFRKLMDGVKQVRRATFKASPIISNFTEFTLLQQYLDLEEMEKRHEPQIGKLMEIFPIYTTFLSTVKGCGPLISAVIVSEIDISMARYPSSLWQFAGLGVESDNRGTSRRKEHLHDIPYTDKDGNPAVRRGIRHNPWLKTKLMGVLAGCMLKAGLVYDNAYEMQGDKKVRTKHELLRDQCSPYVRSYLDYKHRLQTDPARAEWPKGRVHMASCRYMIKRFLVDLYVAWRKLEGLPVAEEYSVAKQGHRHGAGPQH